MQNRSLILVLGDLFALLAFVVTGRVQHGLPLHPVDILAAAAPFAAGWLIMGFITGLYRFHALDRIGHILKKTVVHLFLAVPAGLLIRALLFGHDITLMFAVVSLIFTGIFMLGWRTAFAWIAKIKRSPV